MRMVCGELTPPSMGHGRHRFPQQDGIVRSFRIDPAATGLPEQGIVVKIMIVGEQR